MLARAVRAVLNAEAVSRFGCDDRILFFDVKTDVAGTAGGGSGAVIGGGVEDVTERGNDSVPCVCVVVSAIGFAI